MLSQGKRDLCPDHVFADAQRVLLCVDNFVHNAEQASMGTAGCVLTDKLCSCVS